MNFYFNNSNKNKSEEVAVKKPKIAELYEWVDAVVLSVIVIILLFTFVFRIVGIQGESMMNTLQDEDNILVDKLTYQFSDPQRFDVVLFPYGEGDEELCFIKRVIGLPGETVQISRSGDIFIDGEFLEEYYGFEDIQTQMLS